VSDIVATILLGAITVVLAAVLYVLVTHYTASTSSAPELGASFALSEPQEAVSTSALVAACAAAPCDFYNFTVQSAGKGLELHDLAFQIQGSDGSNVLPTGGVAVLTAANTIVAQTGFPTDWTTGLNTAITDSVTFVVFTSGPTPQSLSGDNLRVVGVSAYSGSIYVHIY
jgi:FlaG/FlaF family flagellin (archaellin)